MPQFVHVLKMDMECDVRKRKDCMYLFSNLPKPSTKATRFSGSMTVNLPSCSFTNLFRLNKGDFLPFFSLTKNRQLIHESQPQLYHLYTLN
jgi:hypothetical protein